MPDFSFEEHYPKSLVAGVDEAGRGPWAGPVVAAAVILDPSAGFPPDLNDSKKLSRLRREAIYEQLMAAHSIGVGVIDVTEIDQLNILQATMVAMKKAVEALPTIPDIALIDGNRVPQLSCKSVAIVKGDEKSLTIAAASIVAKVTRDRIMYDLDKQYPHFGWRNNAGYGTKQHSDALTKFGPTPHHRKSFSPVRKLIKIEEAS